MKIKKFVLPFLDVNCYLVNYKNNNFLIDPGSNYKLIDKYISDNKISLNFIINTHGHFDHIGAVPDLIKKLNIPFYVHEKEEDIIKDPEKNLSSIFISNGLSLKSYSLIKGESKKDFLISGMDIMNFPGHTPGSIIIKIDDCMFTGDVLFKGSIGRTDLPCGSNQDMNGSLKKIKLFERNLKIFPGHGLESTIGAELDNNFFLNSID
ncbi:MAG: MBL fold metallo-hydrolase [Actinomycetota bacterium]|nr:MBL fold metallo-hydrolase [Actinomycetota bacterium]